MYRFLITFICLVQCYVISAQVTFQDAYNDFKQQAQSEYEDFRRKANQEYAEWMRKVWEWHDKIEPMPRPKDEMLPPVIYNDDQRREEPRPMPYDEVVPAIEPQPQPAPVSPIREKDGEYLVATFQFYGTEGKVRLPDGMDFKIRAKDGNGYAEAWEQLSSEKYDNLIRDCLVLRMKHQLCDWAYLMMLGAMSENVCGGWNNEARMMQGFLLCQSGYKIKFGFMKNGDLRLLFNSEHLIFDLGGFEMEDGLFYVIEPIDDEGLNVCEVSYPDERPFSLLISQEQLFTETDSSERLLIPADSTVAIRVQTNKNWMEFCADYPTSMIGEDIVTR